MKLVNCTQEYWEFVRTIRTHPQNENFFLNQGKVTPIEQIEYMEKNSHRFKICLIEDTPVGYIGIKGEHEITYCVDPTQQGKGIGTFMVSEFQKQFNKLTAVVLPTNKASRRVFEKLGFKEKILYTYTYE